MSARALPCVIAALATVALMAGGAGRARPAAAAPAPSWRILYLVSPCSTVAGPACPGHCADRIAQHTGGGFLLAPAPLERPLGGYALESLGLSAQSFSVTGHGLVVISGRDASFLGTIVVNGKAEDVAGVGTAEGEFPPVLRFPALSGRSTTLSLVAVPAPVRDADGDGVLDGTDTCPETPCGEPADEGGCAPSERCPCAQRPDGTLWQSHREYVRCMVRTTRALHRAGRLTVAQRSEIIRAARRSDCGRSALARRGAANGARGVRVAAERVPRHGPPPGSEGRCWCEARRRAADPQGALRTKPGSCRRVTGLVCAEGAAGGRRRLVGLRSASPQLLDRLYLFRGGGR